MSKITTGELYQEWIDINNKLQAMIDDGIATTDSDVMAELQAIKDKLGSVNIENFPDVQKVEVTNPSEPVTNVTVDNLPDVQDVNVTNQVEDVSINNLPDNQDVTVTNQIEFPAELNVNVNNPVDTVSVDNLPDVQKVEVTNTQKEMDVNVLNPVDNVSVNNLPTDYPDSAVKEELELIKQQQAEILDKLNDTIDTRLTGSNVEDEILIERQIRTAHSSFAHADPPKRAIGAIFEFKVYSATGNFEGGKGINLGVYANNEGINSSIWRVRTAKVTQRGGMVYIYPNNISLGDAIIDGNKINDVKVVNLPIHSFLRTRIEFTGTFEGNEGVDCELSVKWLF